MKNNSFIGWAIIAAVLGAVVLFNSAGNSSGNPSPSPSDSISTNAAAPSDVPSPTLAVPPEPVAYWADGLTVDDVTNTLANNRNCTFDMCIFVKVTAHRKCSSIVLDGEVFDANDEVVDDFSQDVAPLAVGKSRIVELGTDALYDTEEYVDLADSTCWK